MKICWAKSVSPVLEGGFGSPVLEQGNEEGEILWKYEFYFPENSPA